MALSDWQGVEMKSPKLGEGAMQAPKVIHVVYAVHGGRGMRQLQLLEGHLSEWAKSHGSSLGRRLIYETKNGSKRPSDCPDHFKWCEAKNAFHDWSAYGAGAAELASGNHIGNDEAILIVNQTAFAKYPWKWMLGKILEYSIFLSKVRPSLCGFRDGYGFLMDEHPSSGSHGHVSCFMALMNTSALALICELSKSCEEVASGDDVSQEQFEALPFDSKMKEFCWMFTHSESTHFKWQRPKRMVEIDLEALLRRKSVALLMEFEFSSRVVKADGFLVDVGHSTLNKVAFLLLRKWGGLWQRKI